MKNINVIKNNIAGKKITVLGAGISGQGAANLAHHLGSDVLLSNNIRINRPNLINDKIKLEFPHTDECLNADLIIISPGINPNNSKIVKKINKKNIPIVSEIEFGSWATKNPIIAITGSNGKSTVVKLVSVIFKKKFNDVMLGGNIGISFCMNILNELKNNINAIHILELSSYQLQKIYHFKPKLSCILNITSDHIKRHGNFANYCKDKLNIIKNANKDSYIVFNQDDLILNKYFDNNTSAIPFSIKNVSNNLFVKSKTIYCSKNNQQIVNQEDTDLYGSHNLSNMTAAVQIAKLFNIKNNDIEKAIIQFEPLNHRMEILDINSNIRFINDSKGTNLFSTLAAVKSINNKILLILGGCNDEQINLDAIKVLSNKTNIYKIVCYGEIGKSISKIIKNSKYIKLFPEAVSYAIKSSIPNSTLLLSPGFKSFDQFKNFEERGNKFKNIIFKYFA